MLKNLKEEIEMLGLFNVMAFIFGLFAILLPLWALIKRNKNMIISYMSLSFCLFSLYCVISEYNHLINVQDWSAMLDITAFLTQISLALLIIVLILNLLLYRIKSK